MRPLGIRSSALDVGVRLSSLRIGRTASNLLAALTGNRLMPVNAVTQRLLGGASFAGLRRCEAAGCPSG